MLLTICTSYLNPSIDYWVVSPGVLRAAPTTDVTSPKIDVSTFTLAHYNSSLDISTPTPSVSTHTLSVNSHNIDVSITILAVSTDTIAVSSPTLAVTTSNTRSQYCHLVIPPVLPPIIPTSTPT